MLWLTNVGQEKGIGDSVATDGGEKKVGCFNKLAFRRWNRKTDKSFLRSEGEGIPSYFRRPSHKQFCNNDDEQTQPLDIQYLPGSKNIAADFLSRHGDVTYYMCDPLNCLPQVELLAPQVEILIYSNIFAEYYSVTPDEKK